MSIFFKLAVLLYASKKHQLGIDPENDIQNYTQKNYKNNLREI